MSQSKLLLKGESIKHSQESAWLVLSFSLAPRKSFQWLQVFPLSQGKVQGFLYPSPWECFTFLKEYLLFVCFVLFCFVFEIRSCYVAQAGFKLVIFLLGLQVCTLLTAEECLIYRKPLYASWMLFTIVCSLDVIHCTFHTQEKWKCWFLGKHLTWHSCYI
jgi:hypothetical protein